MTAVKIYQDGRYNMKTSNGIIIRNGKWNAEFVRAFHNCYDESARRNALEHGEW